MLPPKRTLHRLEVPGTARFLTFSCFRRLPLFNDDLIRERFVEHLVRATAKPGIDLLAWVVMPEHVHLVVMFKGVTGESFCRSLKPAVSKEVIAWWRGLDAPMLATLRDRVGAQHFWQKGGGYDRNVIGDELLEKIAYCPRNPVTRALCEASVDWRWSSARAYESQDDAAGPKISFGCLPRSSRPLT